MNHSKLKLGELLLDAGLVSERELKAALCYQKNQRCLLGASLVKLGFLSDDNLLDFLEHSLQLERVDLDGFSPVPEVLAYVPEDRALAFTVFPIERCQGPGGPALRMAMADPCNLTAIDALEFMTGLNVQPVLASEQSIHAAIQRCYVNNPAPDPCAEVTLDSKTSETTMVSVEKFNKLVELLQAKGLLSLDEVRMLERI